MDNNVITTIDVEDFKDFSHMIDYVDEDVVAARNLEDISYNNITIRLNFFLIISCVEGCIQLDMNNKTYLLNKDDIIICLPTAILSQTKFSSGHKLRIMGFSTNFLHRVVKREEISNNILSHIHKNPLRHIEEKDKSPVKLYEDLIIKKINDPSIHYKKDVLHYLFSAIFCEMMAAIYEYSDTELENEEEPETGIKRASYVFKCFIMEVSKDNGFHRSVSYYADRLCYSPKYVSFVVKQASGRTALEWINDSAIEQIKYQLKHSDKSIKEIADDFNFSNLSFFGKYVKKHLGVSPTKYRDIPENIGVY